MAGGTSAVARTWASLAANGICCSVSVLLPVLPYEIHYFLLRPERTPTVDMVSEASINSVPEKRYTHRLDVLFAQLRQRAQCKDSLLNKQRSILVEAKVGEQIDDGFPLSNPGQLFVARL